MQPPRPGRAPPSPSNGARSAGTGCVLPERRAPASPHGPPRGNLTLPSGTAGPHAPGASLPSSASAASFRSTPRRGRQGFIFRNRILVGRQPSQAQVGTPDTSPGSLAVPRAGGRPARRSAWPRPVVTRARGPRSRATPGPSKLHRSTTEHGTAKDPGPVSTVLPARVKATHLLQRPRRKKTGPVNWDTTLARCGWRIPRYG
jgi:hypothetical protein